MRQIFKFVAVIFIGLAIIVPATMVTASRVDGPLTYDDISVTNSPAVAGKDKVTLLGKGFSHIEAIILVRQNSETINTFNIRNYSLSDTKLVFTVPTEVASGTYGIQLNTDDDYGRGVVFDDQAWSFYVTGAKGDSFKIQSPNGGEKYDIGDKIYFKWQSSVADFAYNRVYISLFRLKGESWDSKDNLVYNYLVPEEDSYLVLSEDQGDDGSASWRIPKRVTKGKYVATLTVQFGTDSDARNFSSLRDWSDQPFSIGLPEEPASTVITPTPTVVTNTPTVTTPTITQPSNISEAFTEGPAHPVGTNIITKSGTIFRIVSNNARSPYTAENIFLSYKFNKYSEVAKATSGDIELLTTVPMPPLDGSLMIDNGTVYIISEGKARQPFGSEAVFKGYGYSYKYVFPADTSFLETYPVMTSSDRIHPDGTLIHHNGTYYIMNSHQRLGVPSMSALESWGYWIEDAVPANKYDLATPVSTLPETRPYNQYRY